MIEEVCRGQAYHERPRVSERRSTAKVLSEGSGTGGGNSKGGMLKRAAMPVLNAMLRVSTKKGRGRRKGMWMGIGTGTATVLHSTSADMPRNQQQQMEIT